MMRLKASSGKWVASPVALSRPAVFTALPVPAQLTRMRSWPCAARALAKAASTSASEVTSTLQNTPPISRATASPFSTLKSKMATLTPWAASARAVAAPRPDAPPVTTAATDELSFMEFSFSARRRSTLALPRIAAFRASRGAVAMPTKALALKWAEDGSRVNAVAPG